MSDKKHRLAFVGCGFVAQIAHLPCYNAHPDFIIEIICDPYLEIRDEIGRVYNVKHVLASHRDLFAHRNDFDAIVVTLPRKMSFYVLQDLLELGKPIITEKPLCLSADNAYRLRELSVKYNSMLTVGYMRTHDSGIKHLADLISEQNRDPITSINCYSCMGNSYAAPFPDIKGTTMTETIPNRIEAYPGWMDASLHRHYEQFLNVFSHITHLVSFILNDKIVFKHALVKDSGEGVILAKCAEIPVSLTLTRGSQYRWIEGLNIYQNERVLSTSLPPAFLKNVPATTTIQSGADCMSSSAHTPNWSWAFYNQADSFGKLISSNDHNQALKDLDRAIEQIEFSASLYDNLIKK